VCFPAHLRSGDHQVLKLLLPHFDMAAHPRVRWAALNCAGQMSTDFAPTLQDNFADPILPAVIGAMNDVNNPRVQAHAASAIINFCDNCKLETIQPYLELLLTTLHGMLTGQLIVQEQAVTAIAAVATCIGVEFTKYYKAFREPLLSLLGSSLGEERRLLRGKTMECVSLIAVAVGRDVFRPDAEFVMKMLMQTQNSMKDDDPQVSFVLKAWVRICRCLGKEFVPFLPNVIKPLLECAARKPEIRIFDRENAVEDNAYEFLPVEDKVIAVKTATLEEKATACSMLNCYAEWLEDGFMPFVGPTAEVLVPLQGYYYSDTVRSAATSTMPCLMRCVVVASKKAGRNPQEMLAELWAAIAPPLVGAIGMETDPSLMVLMLNSLHECMDMAGPGKLPGEAQDNLVNVVQAELDEFMDRRKERDELRADPECDELERERIEEEDTLDEQLVHQLTETVGKVFKYQGDSFLEVFGKRLVGYYIKFLESAIAQDRTVAYCVFDDLIEHAGTPAAMQKLLPMLLPRMLQSLQSADADERQAAVYGLGVASRHGDHFLKVLPQVLQGIGVLLSRPDAREPANVFATENGTSALGKIIQAQAAHVNVGELLPQWLSFLPVSNDEEEAKVVNAQLCDFLERYPEQLLGQGAANLPHIFNCFGSAMHSNCVTEELTHRIVVIIKQLHKKSPPLVEKAIAEVPEKARENLIAMLKA
jgi:importin-5